MKRTSILLLLIVAALGAAYYCYSLTIQEAIVFPVTRNTAINAVPGNLKVLSSLEQIVKTELPGKIKSIKFPSGTGKLSIKKDEVIAELDTTDIDRDIEYLKIRLATVEQREAIGSHLEKEIENHTQDLKNLKTLFEHNQYPEAELQKRQRELTRLERLYEQEKLNHATEKKLISIELEKRLSDREKMTIRSPFDGVLIETYVFEKDHVWGSNNIAKIVSGDYLTEVSINEEDFTGIELDQPVSISLNSHPNQLFQGKITYIFPTANSDTKRRNIYVGIDAPKELLTSGMTGQASIIKSVHENALIIPRRALAGNYVFTVDHSGKVHIRTIQTGFTSIDHVEVLAGLKEGEIVIIEDLLSFRDGQRIKVNKEALAQLANNAK